MPSRRSAKAKRSPPTGETYKPSRPLTTSENEGIVIAVKSAFLKLGNLYDKITPLFDEYGFKPPSAGVIARDLSEKIESSIVQHCGTFTKGERHADLSRFGKSWEVKTCKDSGLTINQSKVVDGESYIVVNYKGKSVVNGFGFSGRPRTGSSPKEERTLTPERLTGVLHKVISS